MSSYSRSLRRLFGSKCAKCNQGFNKKDYVMKVKNKIFHLDCFRCVACSKQLVRGEEFALRDNGLFCKADHIILEKACEHYTGEKRTTSLNTGKTKHRKYFSLLAGDAIRRHTIGARFDRQRSCLASVSWTANLRYDEFSYHNRISVFLRMQA